VLVVFGDDSYGKARSGRTQVPGSNPRMTF
jgi:hypothetical protein